MITILCNSFISFNFKIINFDIKNKQKQNQKTKFVLIPILKYLLKTQQTTRVIITDTYTDYSECSTILFSFNCTYHINNKSSFVRVGFN